MDDFEIFTTQDGSIGLFDKDLGEIYHSRQGAQKESLEKFILPTHFEKRSKNKDQLRVLDICYGIGYNSKNALSFYKNCKIEIDALEWDERLVELSKTIPFFDENINKFLRGEIGLNGAKINFFIQDARKTVQNLDKKYDVIFLDAFAPNKLPTLWSVEFMFEIKRLLAKDGVFATYSSAQPVRKALLTAGFKLGKILDEKGHSAATIAAFEEKFLDTSLDEIDLKFAETKAGIPYRDATLDKTPEEIFKMRQIEFETSNLKSASKFLKEIGKKP